MAGTDTRGLLKRDARRSPCTPERAAKISATMRGRDKPLEHREAIANGVRRAWSRLRLAPPPPVADQPEVEFVEFEAKAGSRMVRQCVANTHALMTAYGLSVFYDPIAKQIVYIAPQLDFIDGLESQQFTALVAELGAKHLYPVSTSTIRQHILLFISSRKHPRPQVVHAPSVPDSTKGELAE